MAKNYTYPHVDISTKALRHSSRGPEAEDTTILFQPIVAEKGPTDRVVKVHSYEEFLSTFGLDCERLGRTALNIANWLTSGGTVYAYRIAKSVGYDRLFYFKQDSELTDAEYDIELDADGSLKSVRKNTTSIKITDESLAEPINVKIVGSIVKIKKFLHNGELSSTIIGSREATDTNTKYNIIDPDNSPYYEEDGIIRLKSNHKKVEVGFESTGTDGVDNIVLCDIDYVRIGTIVAETSDSEHASIATGVESVLNDSTEVAKLKVFGKYVGTGLNDFIVKVSHAADSKYIKCVIRNASGVELERFSVKLEDGEFEGAFINISMISEYLDKIAIQGNNIDKNKDFVISATLSGGRDGYDDPSSGFESALTDFWIGSTEVAPLADSVLKNALELPAEIIMDAGYPAAIKKAMAKFVKKDSLDSDNDGPRSDMRCYLETFDAATETVGDPIDKSEIASTNVFIFDQMITISEETYFGKYMKVGPTYFLSKLIPTNDLAYGIQFPTAGKRRGVLEGVISINENPLPDEKEQLFKDHINYIEKDSRGYYFMSQRTYDNSTEDNYTALSFINNSLVVCRMVHELERLGRDYLFEFNDSLTLTNMSSVLNKYVSTWIANRTLSYGNVVVSRNEFSDEAVDVKLNIKFTGTIEVISIDITIE